MPTTYELYTNENGTPKAVEGKAPAIVERVENLETSVETAQSTADACLPLAGGTMTGVINFEGNGSLKTPTDTGSIQIYGGSAWGEGSIIGVYGKSHATRPGWFYLNTHDGTNTKTLVGKPDGSLTWGGNNLVRSINGSIADPNGNVNVSSLGVTEIPAYTNLNDYKTVGEYRCSATAEAVTLSNCPSDDAFTMTVLYGSSIQQILRQYQGRCVWIRAYQDWNNVWTEWVCSGGRASIVDYYRSGENWYRKYSDGFIEQGGILAYNGSSGTITYHMAYAQNNPVVDYNTVNTGHGEYTLSSVTKTNFTWQSNVNRSGYLFWRASGY